MSFAFVPQIGLVWLEAPYHASAKLPLQADWASPHRLCTQGRPTHHSGAGSSSSGGALDTSDQALRPTRSLLGQHDCSCCSSRAEGPAVPGQWCRGRGLGAQGEDSLGSVLNVFGDGSHGAGQYGVMMAWAGCHGLCCDELKQ
eukprot:1139688-Pelagomonas_calceolata.AAC.6